MIVNRRWAETCEQKLNRQMWTEVEQKNVNWSWTEKCELKFNRKMWIVAVTHVRRMDAPWAWRFPPGGWRPASRCERACRPAAAARTPRPSPAAARPPPDPRTSLAGFRVRRSALTRPRRRTPVGHGLLEPEDNTVSAQDGGCYIYVWRVQFVVDMEVT